MAIWRGIPAFLLAFLFLPGLPMAVAATPPVPAAVSKPASPVPPGQPAGSAAAPAASAASPAASKPVPGANSKPGQPGQPGQPKQEDFAPVAPKIFGADLLGLPQAFAKNLEGLGYTLEIWTLEAPFTRRIYSMEDTAAIFSAIEILECQNPHLMAAVTVRGRNASAFYPEVKDRFGLGIAERQVSDNMQIRWQAYSRDFRGPVRASLKTDSRGPALRFEMPEVRRLCGERFSADEEFFRNREAAEREARVKAVNAGF